MTITLENPNPGASEEALVAFEAEIGTALPAAYRAFLSKHEGGYAESNEFSFPDDSNGDCVQHFETLNEIRDELQRRNDDPDEHLPAGLIPIAYTDVGNWVAINLADESIWFLDHELELDDPEGLVKLADTFDDFDAMVQPFDPSTIELQPGGEVTFTNVEWSRANAQFFTDEYKAAHPEIFGDQPS